MDKNTKAYNPSDVGVKGNIFGLPYDEQNARIAIIPVPWDVTTSSKQGTALAPEAILDKSTLIDLEIYGVKNAWQCAPTLLPIDEDIKKKSTKLRKASKKYIDWLERGKPNDEKKINADVPNTINNACIGLNHWVKETVVKQLDNNKAVGLLGGDHSCCLGFVEVLGSLHNSFSILQIDAHADLRHKYQDFDYSHASVMCNILNICTLQNVVQVGIRDYCREEREVIEANPNRIQTFFDGYLKEKMFNGATWHRLTQEIIGKLTDKVYISFDIDGLSPENCPNTGTPVPGGLTYDMAIYLLKQLRMSNKKVIGFDLCEVVPDKSTYVNEIVATKILLELCLLL